MKYIFVAGAPGSKWSSVVKNIYYSESIDRSDYSDARTYYHDASGKRELMHLGAYFDPGMESDLPEQIDNYSKEHLEAIFDKEFDGTGVRIIKSHIFSNHIDLYPRYNSYYKNLRTMAGIIKQQNTGITDAMWNYKHQGAKQVATNLELCNALGIAWPDSNYRQNYTNNNIKVTVI